MKRALIVILVAVCIFVLVLSRWKKTGTPNVSGVDEKPITPPTSFQPSTATLPSTFKVHSIRLRARDGQPERAVVCSEVKLLMVGKWL